MREHLDRLVRAGEATGYSVEEDPAYLAARVPTLTYRMYADAPLSHLNLGAFAAAVADFGARMRLSRVEGVLGEGGRLLRSRQLCLTAEFASGASVQRAVGLVRERFTASAASTPGSWQLPDVRITGVEPPGTAAAYAHCWPSERGTIVLLSLSRDAGLPGARTAAVRVLEPWLDFLGRPAVAVGA